MEPHSAEVTRLVREEMLAVHVGSGTVRVLATPMMIALMEEASVLCAEPLLLPGQTTVGTHVDVVHTAATPVGGVVRARAELKEQDGKRLVFAVSAEEILGETEVLPIGKGTHTRYVVVQERFGERK
ncbi:MAG: thioesterase family protein [Thermoguttaceae bacterium]